MGAKNTNTDGANFFSMKAKTSDTDPKPYIGQSKKVGDKWEINEKDRFNSIDGHLIGMELSSYIHKEETKNVCKFILKDKDGTTNYLQSNFNNLLYSLLNSLSNCEPDFIDIQVYLGKAKVVNGVSGKQYPGVSLKNNGVDVKWKWQFSELPQVKYEEVMAGKKPVTVADDTEVIDYWKEVIASIALKLKAKPAFVATVPKNPIDRMVDEDHDNGVANSIAAQTTNEGHDDIMNSKHNFENETLVPTPDDDLPF